MRFSTTTALAFATALGVSALPTKRAADIDAAILQYALTVCIAHGSIVNIN